MDSIREASGGVREDLAVLQPLAVFGDVEAVDCGRVCLVVFAGEGVDARICDVDVLEVRAA